MSQRFRFRLGKSLRLLSLVGVLLLTPLAAAGADRTFTVRTFGNTESPPMLFIPGLMSAGDVWEPTAKRYAASYRVHLLTLAGFAGTAPVDADPFLARVRDDVIEYVTTERLVRPVLVGHSLGAFLAFWIASTAPERIGAVVAVDGVPFLAALTQPEATGRDMAERAGQMRSVLGALTPAQLGAQGGLTASAQVGDPADVARIASWASTSHPPTVARVVAEMLTTDLREDTAAIRAPVLLVASAMGGNEASVAKMLDRYKAQVSKVRDVTVIAATGARHFIMLDDPGFLHAEMDRFLARRVAEPAGR